MIRDYTAVDLEMTGLNPKTDRIIEIGAVKVRKGEVCDTYSRLINPGRKLEERVVQLTGICDQELEQAPYIEELTGEILEFLGEDVLLGHGISHDYVFLKKMALNAKQPFQKKALDTLSIARKYLPELESRNLGYLCRYFDIEHREHRALGDAQATHLLYEKLIGKYYEEQAAVFVPKEIICRIKRDTPITIPQKEQLIRLTTQYNISLECEIDKMSRSEAGRAIDRILSQAGHDHS